MDVSCEGTPTARASSQPCTAKAFLNPRSVGRLVVGRNTKLSGGGPMRWLGVATTTADIARLFAKQGSALAAAPTLASAYGQLLLDLQS